MEKSDFQVQQVDDRPDDAPAREPGSVWGLEHGEHEVGKFSAKSRRFVVIPYANCTLRVEFDATASPVELERLFYSITASGQVPHVPSSPNDPLENAFKFSTNVDELAESIMDLVNAFLNFFSNFGIQVTSEKAALGLQTVLKDELVNQDWIKCVCGRILDFMVVHGAMYHACLTSILSPLPSGWNKSRSRSSSLFARGASIPQNFSLTMPAGKSEPPRLNSSNRRCREFWLMSGDEVEKRLKMSFARRSTPAHSPPDHHMCLQDKLFDTSLDAQFNAFYGDDLPRDFQVGDFDYQLLSPEEIKRVFDFD